MNRPVRRGRSARRARRARRGGAAIAAVVAASVTTGATVTALVAGGDLQSPPGSEPIPTGKTIPTIPLSATTVPRAATAEEAQDPGTTVAPAPPAPTAFTGIGVHANAGLSVLVGAVNAALGRQPDLAASVDRLAPLPEGIPTPVDATVQHLVVTHHSDDERFDAVIELATSAAADDLEVFFKATLAASDLTFEGIDATEQNGLTVRTLSYRNDDSEYPNAVLTVEIADAGDVVLTVADHSPPGAVYAFTGWLAPQFPEVDEGRPVRATVAGTLVNDRIELSLETVFEFADVAPAELRDRIVAALPVVGLDLAAGADTRGASLELADGRRQVPELSATFAPSEGGGTLLTVSGGFR